MSASAERKAWPARRIDACKPWLFVFCCYPLLRWFSLGFLDGLGPNPAEFLTRSSGTWTLVGLLMTLTVTPVQVLLRQPALVRVRRMLGLFTFFYACLHVLAWAWWEHGFEISALWEDVLTRPFVSVGLFVFVVFLVLALTSNQWSMHRLKRRWKSLHRWIYLAAVAAIVHYWLHKAGKNDFSEVMVYGAIVTGLLGWRLARFIKTRTRLQA